MEQYLRHRLEQVESERRVIEDFKAKHTVDVYSCIYELNNALRELETQNANGDKARNVSWLAPFIFRQDIHAILDGKDLPLPDPILDIQVWLDELERQRKEEARKRQEEIQLQESKRILEARRQRDAEEKERKKAELCEQLGISQATLTRLQAEV